MPRSLPRLRDQFKNLIGCEIVDVIAQESAEYGATRPDVGLVLEGDAVGQVVVWASADAEGNGPGWFEVAPVDVSAEAEG